MSADCFPKYKFLIDLLPFSHIGFLSVLCGLNMQLKNPSLETCNHLYFVSQLGYGMSIFRTCIDGMFKNIPSFESWMLKSTAARSFVVETSYPEDRK